MGSGSTLTSKGPYDITMSRRTRKPSSLLMPQKEADGKSAAVKGSIVVQVAFSEEEEESDHKSLEQLINGSEEGRVTNSCNEENEICKRRNSLGQHFTEEEKQLQLVRNDKQEAKLKRMFSRYVKVLSHIIKVKRDPPIGSRKKPLHYTM